LYSKHRENAIAAREQKFTLSNNITVSGVRRSARVHFDDIMDIDEEFHLSEDVQSQLQKLCTTNGELELAVHNIIEDIEMKYEEYQHREYIM